MKLSEFDYVLPPDRIAQEPLPDRAAARMLVVDRRSRTFADHVVRDLPALLAPGDLLVLNETRVIPARLFGRRLDTGGRVEVLLVEELEPNLWDALYRATGRARAGLELLLDGAAPARIAAALSGGRVHLAFAPGTAVPDLLAAHGAMPLPPYIRRPRAAGAYAADRDRYQTVYARHAGAIAAPTAGLHLTAQLLEDCARRGIDHTAVTLHVGPGTFKPVACDCVDDHTMESERYAIPAAAAERIAAVDRARNRVVAVGTTTVRACESAVREHMPLGACAGRTALFIRPPFDFRVTDALLTNFHLPKSTLLMLVAALAGRDLMFGAYRTALERGYRFYSYGDCMLIL
jgi:S-adenosylmethionine:tRNA ribosyltransferase-isomerase